MTTSSRRLPSFCVMIFCVIVGVGILLYHGPGTIALRNYGGDVVATIGLHFLIRLFVRWRSWQVGLLTFIVACLIETNQLWWHVFTTYNTVASLAIGTTFDWMDIAMYAVGTIMAMGIHQTILNKSPF